MTEWIQNHEALLWVASAVSFLLFVGTLFALPLLVGRIPPDYFLRERRHLLPWSEHHPVLRWLLIIAKNVFGLLLVVAGLCMLFLPGQGLVTLVVGTLLLDFPGKYRLERWLIRRRAVRSGINWLRARRGHGPLHISSTLGHDEQNL